MLHNPLGSQGRDKSELSPSCRARLWCGNDSSSTRGPPAPSAGNVNLGITQEEMLWGCSALKWMDCRAWIYPHLVSTMSGLTPQEHSGRAGSSVSTGDTTGSPHIAPPAVWVCRGGDIHRPGDIHQPSALTQSPHLAQVEETRQELGPAHGGDRRHLGPAGLGHRVGRRTPGSSVCLSRR